MSRSARDRGECTVTPPKARPQPAPKWVQAP
jgi:hypothetical protein